MARAMATTDTLSSTGASEAGGGAAAASAEARILREAPRSARRVRREGRAATSAAAGRGRSAPTTVDREAVGTGIFAAAEDARAGRAVALKAHTRAARGDVTIEACMSSRERCGREAERVSLCPRRPNFVVALIPYRTR